ncbi:MAG TPA: hypothetical protein VF696_02230 [Candidatus Paceibacterota bacterium]
MNCPHCSKPIDVLREDESNNSKDGTVYTRKVYECKNCGTWTTTEVPK